MQSSKISQENIYAEVSFNKVARLKVWNFIKNRLQHMCFPVKFVEFFKKVFLQYTCGGCFWKWKDISSSLQFLLP